MSQLNKGLVRDNNKKRNKDMGMRILNECNLTYGEKAIVNGWISEIHDRDTLIISSLDASRKFISFALLSRMDFDPFEKHKNPWCLNFIFTIQESRNKGYAKNLLYRLRLYNKEVTVFVDKDNISSKRLFISNGYRFCQYIAEQNIVIYAYP